MSFNKSILIGRLTADPELKVTPQGTSVTSFKIAVDRPYSKGDKKTDFLSIVAWQKSAEFVTKYFKKGNQILIEGSIQVRDYTDKDGNKRYITEIVAERVNFVDSKANGGSDSNNVPNNEKPSQLDFDIVDDTSDLPF